MASSYTCIAALVFWSALQLGFAVDDVPHPACVHVSNGKDQLPGTIYLECPEYPANFERYVWPTNFNVSRLPAGIAYLRVSRGVVLSDAPAIPERAKLISVDLFNFNLSPGEGRFPLQSLFLHTKATLEYLLLSNVNLVTVAAKEFSGFQKLKRLMLHQCLLTSVDKAAFEEIGIPIPGSMPVQYSPQITQLEIMTNSLGTLDWSIFKPISQTVQFIHLKRNRLETLSLSENFLFKNLTTLRMYRNKLPSIDRKIYETFGNPVPGEIDLSSNPFCPSAPDCSCCELAPFIGWLRQKNAISSLKMGKLSCGGRGNGTVTQTQPSYQHCAQQ